MTGSHRQFRVVASNFGIETTYIDATDLSQVEEALRDNTKVDVYAHTVVVMSVSGGLSQHCR